MENIRKSVSLSFSERFLILHKHKERVDLVFQKMNIHSKFPLLPVYQNNILQRTASFPGGTTAVNFYTAIQQKLVAARCF
jgi:hypothetical protein